MKNGRLKQIHAASLTIHGVNLFNTLPKSVRDLTGIKVDVFKRALDTYLKNIPDEPLLPGYTKYRRASSNSIIHMIKVQNESAARRHSNLDTAGADGSAPTLDE